jgi:hypothetical protein
MASASFVDPNRIECRAESRLSIFQAARLGLPWGIRVACRVGWFAIAAADG